MAKFVFEFAQKKILEKGYFEKGDIDAGLNAALKSVDHTDLLEGMSILPSIESQLKVAFDDVLIGRDRGGDGGMGVGV